MEWIEAKITTTSEGVEAICGVLMQCGITGIQIEDTRDMKAFLMNNKEQWDYIDEQILNSEDGETIVKFYVSSDLYGHECIANVKLNLERLSELKEIYNLGELQLHLENVDDENWLNEWKKYYKPFEIGEKIVVKPTWEDYENDQGKIVFNINPGHVFGTGLHQTTKLCVIALEKALHKDQHVLDLGCGSGILSIISLLLGAEFAYAVDIDHNAVNIAYENSHLNGIQKDRYKVVSGNILENEDLRAEILKNRNDIVLANIVADVIMNILPFVSECISENGTFVSSGIISERLDEVKHSLQENGFEIKEIMNLDDWYCVVSIKKNA